MSKHLKLLSILTFAQAGLEIIAGVFYMAMGPFMRTYMDMITRNSPNPPQNLAGFDEAMGMFTWIYVAIGSVVIIGAIFRIVAGVQLLKRRGRILNIVSLFCGLASVITCYCLPTSVGLLIFGLIVLLNDETAAAMSDRLPQSDIAQTFE